MDGIRTSSCTRASVIKIAAALRLLRSALFLLGYAFGMSNPVVLGAAFFVHLFDKTKLFNNAHTLLRCTNQQAAI